MSEKTKIVVIHMKELLYTIVFTVLIIILMVVLIYMFLPQSDSNNQPMNSQIPSQSPVASEEIPFNTWFKVYMGKMPLEGV